MKKLLTKSVLVLFIAFSLINFTSAEDAGVSLGGNSVLVATVNIYNSLATKIDQNNYQISFDINNREGVQSDIRYGIELIRKSDNLVADTYLENISLTLGENETKNISLNYVIPAYVQSGEYKLVAVSKNASGLPLAKDPIVSGESVYIDNSNEDYVSLSNCFTNNIDNINTEQELTVSCAISSNKTQNFLNIGYAIHKNSQFGDILSQNEIKNVNVLNDSVSFKIMTDKNPGQYVLDIFLKDNGYKISPSYELVYFVNGNSVVIQNTTIDKSSYSLGDIANLKLFYKINGALATNTSYKIYSSILDENANQCGSSTNDLNTSSGFRVENINIDIDSDCENAIAKVLIMDGEQNVLANSEINLNNKISQININPNLDGSPYAMKNSFYIVIFLLILVLLGYGIIVFKKHNNK